jgi:diacylglycerol kinase (ATP)
MQNDLLLRRSAKVHSGADRVLILVNPKAGRESAVGKVEQLAALLRRCGLHVDISADLDDTCRKANQTQQRGQLRALVSVGGDGTVAELVNRTEIGVPICLYPLGTANLLAGHLGLAASPTKVCRAIRDGVTLKMDAGNASGRVFLLMASCGFDAHVAYQVHRRRQQALGGHLTRWSYVKPILDTMRSYQYPEIRVYWDFVPYGPGEERSGSLIGRWVFISNVPPYGWGVPLVAWADGTDGVLDLCGLEGTSWEDALRYVLAAHCGRLRGLSDCKVARATRLRIVSDRPVMYQLDGDPAGWLPVEIEVLPCRVTLVVPGGSCFRA